MLVGHEEVNTCVSLEPENLVPSSFRDMTYPDRRLWRLATKPLFQAIKIFMLIFLLRMGKGV